MPFGRKQPKQNPYSGVRSITPPPSRARKRAPAGAFKTQRAAGGKRTSRSGYTPEGSYRQGPRLSRLRPRTGVAPSYPPRSRLRPRTGTKAY